MQIIGPALDSGRELAEQVRRRIAEAKLSHVQIVERLDAPGYELAIDAPKAADLGITAAEIRSQVALATGGQGSSWLDPASGVRLRIVTPFIRSVVDLQNLPVGGARQRRQVRLGDVVQIQRTVAPVEIDHVGLQRVTRVRVYVEEREHEAAIKTLRGIIANLPTSPGMRVQLVE